MFKKKEKYVENKGIFKNAVDYAVYHMKLQETVIGALIGAAIGSVVVQIFFGIPLLTIVLLPVYLVGGVLVSRNILLKRRKAKLIKQFRDMLEAVSSSLGSGRNVTDSFDGAMKEMAAQYGVNASIVKELEQINEGLANNINIEILLQDFAARSHDENVQNFADVFEVANRRGGNIRQIILETKNVINDKIMVEQDIQTIISGKKNELNIMMIMPLIVVNMTKSATGDSNGMVGFLVKLAAFCMFILAYVVGQKMMKIEV